MLMVKGINSRMKKYVKVTSTTDEDGRVMPLSIEWDDGVRYEIDTTVESEIVVNGKTYRVGPGSYIF